MPHRSLALIALASLLVLLACADEEPLVFGLEIDSPVTESLTAPFPVGVVRGHSTDAAQLRLNLTAGEKNWGFELRHGTVLLFDIGEAQPGPVVLPGMEERPTREESLAAVNERLASVAETVVMRVHDTRPTFLVDLPPGQEGRIDDVVHAAESTAVLAFFIEVLPTESYGRERKAPRLEEPPHPWPRSADAFAAFKKAEVEAFLAARKAGRAYEPTELGFFVLPRHGTEAEEVGDFAVLELPSDPSYRFGGDVLGRARVGRDPNTGKPVVLYDVKQPYRTAFGAWTGANIGLPMAIVLDWEYRSAPYINSRLDGSVQITLGTGPWSVLEAEAKALAKGLSSPESVAVARLVGAATWRRDGAFEILRPLEEHAENVIALEATGYAPGEKARLERVLTRDPDAAGDGKTAADARLAEVRLGTLTYEDAARSLAAAAEEATTRLEEIAPGRVDAARLLACLESSSKAAYLALADRLDDDDAEVRNEAAEALGEMEPSPVPVDALLAAVRRGDEVSHTAAGALAHHARKIDAAFQGLLALAGSDVRDVRHAARNALSGLLPERKKDLRKAAHHDDPAIRAAAVEALAGGAWNEEPDEELIAFLIEATQDDAAVVRLAATGTLAALSQMFQANLLPHLDALTPLLDDEDERVRQNLGMLLNQMGKPVVPGVLRVLDSGSPTGRAMALFVLGRVKDVGPVVTAAIEKALDDVSLLVRVMAAASLCGQTGEMGRLIPLLEESAESDDEEVRMTAVGVLFTLANDDKEDAPFVLSSLLERFLDDEEENIRVFAAVALEGMGAMNDRAHEILDAVRADETHPMRGFTQSR